MHGSAAIDFQPRWQEEFDPCVGPPSNCVNGLRTSLWNFEFGDGSRYGPGTIGWGNGEAQCYTRDRRNVRAVKQAGGSPGVLVIEAHFSPSGFPCTSDTSSAVDATATAAVGAGATGSATTGPAFSDAPTTRYWSSGRITTRNKAAFMWANASSAVKVEARIKFPQELGAWPVFWMLPDTPRNDCLACGAYGNGWCTSGEIDIAETRNRDPRIRSTLHFGGLKDQPWLDCKFATADYADLAGRLSFWTRVSVVWAADSIIFAVNDTVVQSIPSASWYTGAAPDKAARPSAPFDQPFHLLLDLAVGGAFPAAQFFPGGGASLVTDTARAPYRMLMDWVRVYDQVLAGVPAA
ncbi:hypothetical protein HXX76_002909 [Chlamydomonas incerta]|uniref:GH16 domain-containing protein n=1 Tax=Chlamydomonas incerta TaxID=51695 RepID=A0A835TPG8_CHLIN|nr:hypothetical protein HXX76_002909 [Chlamydomonas incerta]|eukprot:KAG2442830.1 hypothetical protein HXX76_002909 [Chlamydomonas incerta]